MSVHHLAANPLGCPLQQFQAPEPLILQALKRPESFSKSSNKGVGNGNDFFLQNHKVFLHHTPEHRTTLITGEFYSKTGRWRLNDITTCFSTCHVIEQPDDSFGMQKIAVDCGDLIVALQNADQGSDNATQGSEHLQDIIYFKSQHLNLHLTTCKHYVNVSELQRSCCLQNPWVVATLQPASLNLASSSGRDLRSCNCHVVRAEKPMLGIPTRVFPTNSSTICHNVRHPWSSKTLAETLRLHAPGLILALIVGLILWGQAKDKSHGNLSQPSPPEIVGLKKRLFPPFSFVKALLKTCYEWSWLFIT